MRYRKAVSRADDLGQISTPDGLAALLARYADRSTASVLELGVGRGALIAPLLSRIPDLQAVGVDIDADALAAFNECLPRALAVRTNVLSRLALQRALGDRQFDAAIGNPPFTMHRASASRLASLARTFEPGIANGKWVRDDVIFFLESWQRLRAGGQALFILPSPLLIAPAYRSFRQWLLSQSSSLLVAELGNRAFDGVEVESFLVVARKRRRCAAARQATLLRLGNETAQPSKLSITAQEAEQRLDLRFHEVSRRLRLDLCGTSTLGLLGGQVLRGSRSHTQLEQLKHPHVHTCDFSEQTARLRFGRVPSSEFNTAAEGDLLIPRVGTRCLLRQAVVVRGRSVYTEAVYRIRVDRKWQERVLDTLQGEAGRLWREVHARGSCAKFLAVDDLLAMPVVN